MTIPQSKLTAPRLLTRMASGIHYSVGDLRRRTAYSNVTVQGLLEHLVEKGCVSTSLRADNCVLYTKIDGAEYPVFVGTKAEALIPHLMTGELSGYESQFARHRDLCMTLRRFA